MGSVSYGVSCFIFCNCGKDGDKCDCGSRRLKTEAVLFQYAGVSETVCGIEIPVFIVNILGVVVVFNVIAGYLSDSMRKWIHSGNDFVL